MMQNQTLARRSSLPFFLIFACLGSTICSATQGQTEFINLFAAGDLSDWRVGKKGEGWSIQDGVVRLEQIRSGSLVSRKKYKNFELRFEWNISEGGNSGIIYRMHKGRGLEYQLLDDKRHVRGKDPLGTTGAIYDLCGASTDKPYKPAGQWNTARIVADGDHIEHWLNGAKVAELDVTGDDWDRRYKNSKYPKYKLENFANVESPILFQDHGHAVSFRNVRLREIVVQQTEELDSQSTHLDFQTLIAPLPESGKFVDEDFYIWGGSAIKGPVGKYHLLYSRWPRSLTHFAWVTHSEIAHAVADSPLGPFKHVDVALPKRGKAYWDGLCTHNPTVHFFEGKYYLYYMGNTGDLKPPAAKKKLNFTHRNNQRIGVAVADHPAGPWKRFDQPLIDVSANGDAHDALMTSNPSICRRPDGTYLLIYKAVGKKRKMPSGGPVVHLAATSDSPTGPFTKLNKPLFTSTRSDFPAEDPYIWAQGDRCWAIVNDHKGIFNKTGEDSLALFSSVDGLDWQVAAHPLVAKRNVEWESGRKESFYRLERPQLIFENGQPIVLYCAAEETKAKKHSYNLHIPLRRQTKLEPPKKLNDGSPKVSKSQSPNSPNSPESKPDKPNVVIIMVDDMGYGDPGCYNTDSKIPTPNIDSLAKSGMRFMDAHAPGALCHLSRYGLLTGEYPFRATPNKWRERPSIKKGQTTIASLMKNAGYQTAMVGKWHLGFDESGGFDKPMRGGPIDRGFDSFFGIRASTDIPPYFYIRGDRAVKPPTEKIEARASEDEWTNIQGAFSRAGLIATDLKLKNVLPRFTDEAIKVIQAHAPKPDKPLMLYLAYPAPHTPWLPSKEFAGESGASMYGDFAMMVDAMIGRVLKSLDESGMSKNTLVIFTSDNGPVWYAKDVARFKHDSVGGLRGMKADAWEGGHRMPFIVRWPDVTPANSKSYQTICFTDVLATLAEITSTKLDAKSGPDSFSFLKVLTGNRELDKPVRPPIVMSTGKMKLIRSGNWKLISGLGSGGFSKPSKIKPKAGQPAGQLYDLAEDPAETHNVYAGHPDVVKRLTDRMKEIVEEGYQRDKELLNLN
ncbi:MAG: sulfatase-like hydrolase/transferase [Mariniblastus sp.]